MSDTFECPRCHTVLGPYVDIKGQEWLSLGNKIIVRNVFGVCANCGEQIHYSVGDRMLSELVTRVLEERKRL